MSPRSLVWRGIEAVTALLPDRVLRTLLRGWLDRVARREPPGAALRLLLDLEQDVYGRIDTTAIRYDEGVHAKHRLTGYHDFFVERIGPQERVLDVGCGIGALAHDIAERTGATVRGVDINGASIAFARSRFQHPRLELVEGDARDTLPSDRFDVVVLSNVLEHIEHRVEFLRGIVDAARPARLLVRVPMLRREWLVPLRRELGLPHFSDATHFIEYEPAELEAELRAVGFEPVELIVVWGELWATAVAALAPLAPPTPVPPVSPLASAPSAAP